jgi:alpha-beta hydrolase superfamily lysophospholipase
MKKGFILTALIISTVTCLMGCGKAKQFNITQTALKKTEQESPMDSTYAEQNKMDNIIMNNEKYTVFETGFERENKHIYGNLYVPNTSLQKYPTVIISHGYEGSYREMIPYAENFAEHGIAAYVFDFCGGSYSSKSDGDSTEMSVLTEEADLTAVVNGLSSVNSVDSSRLFLMGESQGGMVSALTAADNISKIKAMILLYPALVIPDNARERYHSVNQIPETMDLMGMKVGKIYYADVLEMDVFQKIKGYSGDVLILHGDKDTLVPISYSERAVKEYQSASLTVIKNGDHGFYGDQQGEAAGDSLNFLKDHIN